MKALTTGVGVAAVAVMLTLLAVLVSTLAALGSISLGCAMALFVAVRRLQSESRRAEINLINARDKYDAVVGSLCGALELEDSMRANHVARVRQLACILAAEMGMGKDDIGLLQKASILADTGKMEIAQGILNKPGALTEQEWAEMKRHPEFGYSFLVSIRPLRDAGEIVLAHHERYDGQGYPRGLRGDEIPMGARIFTIVDAYTAMTSDRPHRKKISHEVAIKEILRNSLTQFDPEVVRAFVRCEERGLIAGSHTPETPELLPSTLGIPSAA
ncbi:MAG: HD-GYP domain-containing protein [Chloroflexota bacterium]|nr:HD-GYP domain-containing protein [Chloroflexota bacterium]